MQLKSKLRLGCPDRVKFTGKTKYADMAELADALDSGSNECKFVQVQVLLSAPRPRVSITLGFFIKNPYISTDLLLKKHKNR